MFILEKYFNPGKEKIIKEKNNVIIC